MIRQARHNAITSILEYMYNHVLHGKMKNGRLSHVGVTSNEIIDALGLDSTYFINICHIYLNGYVGMLSGPNGEIILFIQTNYLMMIAENNFEEIIDRYFKHVYPDIHERISYIDGVLSTYEIRA